VGGRRRYQRAEFKPRKYRRAKKVVAETAITDVIRAIGIRKTMELTKMSQHTIEKVLLGIAVKRKTHEHVLKAIQAYKRDTTVEPRPCTIAIPAPGANEE
jgi:hypothetical protein